MVSVPLEGAYWGCQALIGGFQPCFHKEAKAEKTTLTISEEREVEVSKPTDRCAGSVKSSSTRESGSKKFEKI